VIVPDDTLGVWEFRAHTDSAKRWLELSGNNIRRVGTYDFIVLQNHDHVAAMRASAE